MVVMPKVMTYSRNLGLALVSMVVIIPLALPGKLPGVHVMARSSALKLLGRCDHLKNCCDLPAGWFIGDSCVERYVATD